MLMNVRMPMMSGVCSIVLLAGTAGSAFGQSDALDQTPSSEGPVYFDSIDQGGLLTGGQLFEDVGTSTGTGGEYRGTYPASGFVARSLEPIDNRVQVVFLGDGYIESDVDLYRGAVQELSASMFMYEPFTTYEGAFQTLRVELISQDRGIDHDPGFPIYRDTPLGMGVWCFGTRSLICFDNYAVSEFLSQAELRQAVDLTVLVGRSNFSASAAAPGSRQLAVTGHNSASSALFPHLVGHAFAGLVDEYGSESGMYRWELGNPGNPNVSAQSETEMLAQESLWSNWLGAPDPSGGFVGTFEGAYGYDMNLYRPSSDSMMRTPGRAFNAPSREAIVKRMYEIVSPIDSASPAGEISGVASVETLPVNHDDMVIQWYIDNEPIAGANGTTFDVCASGAVSGQSLSVRVTDMTDFVRDEAFRAEYMSDYRQWTVAEGGRDIVSPADFNGDGRLNSLDVAEWLAAYQADDMIADFNQDGQLNGRDVSAFLLAYSEDWEVPEC